MSTGEPTSLFLPSIGLVDSGQPVEAPSNIVYSTAPRTALSMDGQHYVLKGPDINVVVAELSAYVLAGLANLPVPEFGIAATAEGTFFACREVKIRNVSHWITAGKLTNASILVQTVVFDIWIANVDRNFGNFVGLSLLSDGRIELRAIDFEKSVALRGKYPLTTVPMVEPKDFWPRESLGELLKGKPIPHEFCDTIRSIPGDAILRALNTVSASIPGMDWAESSEKVIKSRANDIHKLVRDVWRQ